MNKSNIRDVSIVNFRKKINKRGWIHILEATIAVLIVAGVMMSVYSDQSAREVLSVEDYSYSLQNQILEDIATTSDLRSDAMRVIVDLPGDPAYEILDAFVAAKIPDDFGYLLRVCNLGDPNDYCKMPQIIFYATMDKDVFVEDVVISAEVGNGTEADYSPKKIRLFFWEGGFPDGYCRDECDVNRAPLSCSTDFSQVLRTECGEFDMTDACLEYGSNVIEEELCDVVAGEVCMDGECVATPFRQRICKERSYEICDVCADTDWYAGLCSAYDDGQDTGDCNGGDDDDYSCWNFVDSWESACVLPANLPDCLFEYANCGTFLKYVNTESTVVPCICVDIWSPSLSDYCPNVLVPQTSNCGNVRSVAGEKDCTPPAVASLSLDFSNIIYEWVDPNHYYYYTRTFAESNGVGVTLTQGQQCFVSVGCGSNSSISYRIDANGQYSQSNRQWYTSYSSDAMTLKYWGIDDNGNQIYVEKSMNHPN